MHGIATTPAASHLFQVKNKSPEYLTLEKANLFHTMVAKLLLLAKRARPDILKAVSLLCSRVKKPNVDDYKKLARVMRPLRGKTDIRLTLECNNTNVIKWWADASFVCHDDMRSHTGGIMSLGKEGAFTTSTQQKRNRSSTEAELVVVNNIMPQVLWTRNFLTSQGMNILDNVIHQDNKSAIFMKNNGKSSSSKRT
jgi:hypothetical protein